jgi:hypothetical protein
MALLGKDGRYKKHILCVIVANKKMEQFVDDELLFPYPFAGRGQNMGAYSSGSQGPIQLTCCSDTQVWHTIQQQRQEALPCI